MTSLIYLSECSSTQEKIEHFLNLMDQKSVGIYTFKQTNGKGQYGNTWESRENLNVAYSLAIPTAAIKLPLHLLNFRTAALVAEFVANLTANPVQIKWPNDIIIKNKKIAGILTEKKVITGQPFFVFGIGLNILQENFNELTKAGSILTQTGIKLELKELAEALHQYLINNLMIEISAAEVVFAVNNKLFRQNAVSVFEIDKVRQNGIIQEVDLEGRLYVDLEISGLKKFYNKEISLLY